MANLNDSMCVCDHSKDNHFKYSGPLARGRCKLDGINEHYCLQFESKTAEAERERLYQETMGRAGRLHAKLVDANLGLSLRDQILSGGTITFRFEGHRYLISEVEDND